MKGFTKKILSAVMAITLVIGLTASVSAAAWDSYLDGRDKGNIEAAKGAMTKNTAAAWTASMEEIGWNGVWGGQVFQKVSIPKGKAMSLKFNIKSTNCNKFVLSHVDDHGTCHIRNL